MICSGCSQRVRPVVACDIDGTWGDYYEHFQWFCRVYYYRDCGVTNGYDGSVEFEEYLGLTKAEYREAKLAYRQGGMKRWLPLYWDTLDFVNKVRSLDVEIWVATTRPWASVQNIDPDTQEWLRRNGITVDGLLYGDNKYHQLLEAVDPGRIVGVVDDLTLQVDLAGSLGLPVVQVARHHNTENSTKAHPRLALTEAAWWIAQQTESWYDRYGS